MADKLYWTFQAEKIGDLVSKGADGALSSRLEFQGESLTYGFGKDTTKQITVVNSTIAPRKNNSIFFPAKEILSLHQIILKSREQDKSFGFDDTYLDLARALRHSTKKGKNFPEFAESRQRLENIIGGKVEFDEHSGRWIFRKGLQKFPIGVTAEGIKKIAILDTLLGNRYLDTNSIVFIDEPEAALHPTAISDFMDIVAMLAKRGVQFFMATHSYFIIKKLFLISQELDMSIPTLHHDNGTWNSDDLKDGMPQNTIIKESVRLYEKEVDLAFQ